MPLIRKERHNRMFLSAELSFAIAITIILMHLGDFKFT